MHRVDGLVGERSVTTIEIIGYDAAERICGTSSFDNHGAIRTYKATLTDRTRTITGRLERYSDAFDDEEAASTGPGNGQTTVRIGYLG